MASVGDTILSLVDWLPNATAEALAGILVAWDTARTVVRQTASTIAQAATQGVTNETLAKYQDVPLSPAVLADMSIRSLTIPTDASGLDPGLVAEAAFSGISPQRFAALSLDTGEPYGVIDALRLLHQGTYLYAPVANPDTSIGQPAYIQGPSLGDTYGIGMDELNTVVHYSRVRDQFIPDLLKLAYSTMSGADVINAVVKGRIGMDLGLQLFEAAGGMPEQFELLVETSGDAVGVEHAATLLAHGAITEHDFEGVVLQSRINPRFYPIAKLANLKWLSPFQIHQALAAGEVDVPTATQWIIEDGYPADQAAAFASAGASSKVAKVKNETEAMILSEYEAQIITDAEATTALGQLGYSATAIPYILASVVAKRVISLRNAGINRVRSGYVSFVLDETAARTDLARLGMQQVAIEQAITTWTIEQQTNVRRLSMAQVGKLVEDGVITADNAVARWQQMGYSPEEANLLLSIYPPLSKAPTGTVAPASPLPPDGTTSV